MQYVYDQFIFRRAAGGRVFVVNSRMPFEHFLFCFQMEQPLFLVSQLDDGRIAIVPNAMCIPGNLLQFGYWPPDLLPQGLEYVTIKQGTYPVIISAHPLTNFEEWFRTFLRFVEPFATQSLATFVTSSREVLPLTFEFKETKEAKFSPRKEFVSA